MGFVLDCLSVEREGISPFLEYIFAGTMPPKSARALENARNRAIALRKAKCGDPSGDGGPPFLTEDRIREVNENLEDREFFPSRFYHKPSMIALGADAHLQVMFKNIGWQGFLNKVARSINAPTLEFLQTYAYDLNQRVVTFKLQNMNFQLTFDQINEGMGVDLSYSPLADRFSKHFLNFKTAAKTEFWHHISDDNENFDSHKRDYRIIHPMWILAHRILASTITSRRESGQVNATEIFVLYCMYKKIPVDFCDFFMVKCDSIRGRAAGDIGIGGLVSILASLVGANFGVARREDSPDNTYLTLKALNGLSLLSGDTESGFTWLTGTDENPKAKFPCFRITPQLMSSFKFNNRKTWKPDYHFMIPQYGRERGESSGAGGSGSGRGNDEMEEDSDEDERMVDEEEEVDEQGREYPLSVHAQLASMRISQTQQSRDIGSLLQNQQTQQQTSQQTLLALQQIQSNQYYMSQQVHDIWSHLWPDGGYPRFEQFQPPPHPYYPYPQPRGGYPAYYPPPPPPGDDQQ